MREAAVEVEAGLACRRRARGKTEHQHEHPLWVPAHSPAPRLFKRTVLRHTLTKKDLEAGGRPRDPLEVALSLSQDEAAFFPTGPFPVQTDDGVAFEASVTGTRGKGTPPSAPPRRPGDAARGVAEGPQGGADRGRGRGHRPVERPLPLPPRPARRPRRPGRGGAHREWIAPRQRTGVLLRPPGRAWLREHGLAGLAVRGVRALEGPRRGC